MRGRALSIASARGALLAAAPTPAALVGWWYAQDGGPAPLWADLVAVAMTTLLAFAATVLPRRPGLARVAAAIGLFGLVPLTGPSLLDRPALALALIVLVTLALVALARATDPGTSLRGVPLDRGRLRALAARGAGVAALALWFVSTLVDSRAHGHILGLAALGLTVLVPLVAASLWVPAGVRSARARAVGVAVALAAGLALAAVSLVHDTTARLPFDVLAVTVALIVVLVPGHRDDDARSDSLWEPITGHPERVVVATFALLCLAGTLLLVLPASSATGDSISVADAAFTAVSAVCVTGLVVLDTGADFSLLGQGFILLLIQVGGLGIMTFSTFALQLLGRRVSMRHEGVVARIAGTDDYSSVFTTLRRIIVLTLGLELLGAALLLPSLLDAGLALDAAIWKALFTAISAFCNAGFALDGGSLIGFAADPAFLHVVALLIIAGGLSPVALAALPTLVRARRRASVHVRALVYTTLILLFAGFFAFLALEWTGVLADLSPGDRVSNAWFSSVTLRTAGFNTVDFADVHVVTYLVMLGMMFVGGSPGGTAGGVRTTTVAILVLAVVAAVRGRDHVRVFGHRIPHPTVYRAAAIATVMLAAVFVATAALLLTQSVPPRDLLFEVVSALATVGLSTGATAELDGVGRGVIMACMFLGRVGILTLLMFLGGRHPPREPWSYPEGRVDVV